MTYNNYLSPTSAAAEVAEGSISGLAHPVDRDNVLARPELRVLRLRLAVPNTTKQGNKMDSLYISEAGTEGRYSLDGMNTGANYGEYDTSTEAVAEAKRLIAEGIADSYTVDGN